MLILASGSPRRLELLRLMGIEPAVRPADIDESVRPGEGASTYVERLALEKCAAVDCPPDSVVLAADTAVVVDGAILGKPRHATEATEFIRMLSGRSHEVHTGVAVRSRSETVCDVAVTGVDFAALSDDDIDWYVATREGLDKAGAYAIQGAGGYLVDAVHGSLDNVVGLPRQVTAHLFASLGLRLLDFAI